MEDAFLDSLIDEVFEMGGWDGPGRFPFHRRGIISDDQALDLFLEEPSLNHHVIQSFLKHPLLYCLLLKKGIDHRFPLSKWHIDLIPLVPSDISKGFCRRGLVSLDAMPLEVFVGLCQNRHWISDCNSSSCGIGERTLRPFDA